MYAWIPRSGVDIVACRVVQAYLKRCCSLCEAVVETKVCSKVCCLAPPTDLHSAVRGVRKPLFSFVLMLSAWIPCPIAMLHISWTVHVQAICRVNCTVHTQLKHASHLFKTPFSGKAGSCFLKVPTASLSRPRKVTQLGIDAGKSAITLVNQQFNLFAW